MLSGTEKHNINMISPFNGQMYLDLLGSDVPYSLEITLSNELEALDPESGMLETELPDCGWKFYKWNFGEDINLAEITLSIPDNLAGLYVFGSDYLPFAMPDPAETTRFFVRKYEMTESLLLGLYIGECEQNSGEKLTLSVTGTTSEPEKWTHGTKKDPVEISAGMAYQGFFDTNSDFYENFFEFTAEKDGTLYILTYPDRETTAFDIDTVVTLLQNDPDSSSPFEVDTSDDMITTLHFNKYSFITRQVKKGEKYTIKITPFMSESSNIEAMNLKGYYILDLYLK